MSDATTFLLLKIYYSLWLTVMLAAIIIYFLNKQK